MKNRLIVALLCLLASFSLADSFSTSIENDVIVHTDKYYTHGTRFSYLWEDSFSLFDGVYVGKEKSTQFSLGQYMYTPKDKDSTEPVYGDRPYCGWLYGGFALFARDEYWCDSWELDIGTVGPNSLADKTQKLIHKWTGSKMPMGWDNQIDNEVGADLIYQKKYRYRAWDVFDIIPHAGGSVGNIFTYANGGGFARLGYNLPDDFGVQRMEPTARVMKKGAGWLNWVGIYGYIDWDNRWVIHNITLDGNTFKESMSVDKEPYVMDTEYGVNVTIWRISFTYGANYRTKEFEGQPESETYGTAVISFSI